MRNSFFQRSSSSSPPPPASASAATSASTTPSSRTSSASTTDRARTAAGTTRRSAIRGRTYACCRSPVGAPSACTGKCRRILLHQISENGTIADYSRSCGRSDDGDLAEVLREGTVSAEDNGMRCLNTSQPFSSSPVFPSSRSPAVTKTCVCREDSCNGASAPGAATTILTLLVVVMALVSH